MKRLFVILLAAVAAIALAPLSSGAQVVGTFTQIKGDVDVTPPGEAVRPVKPGDEVFVGDIVRSKPASRAEIRFIDDSVLRLAENSRIEITEYMVEPRQSSSVLKLFRGKVQSIVTTTGKNFGAGKRDRYEIHTPTAVCGVRGTNFFTYFLNGVSGAVFQEGSGYGYSNNRPDEVRIIQTGEAMLVTSADEPPEVNPVTGSELGGHAADTSPEDDGDGDGGGEDQGQGGSGDGGSSQGPGGSTGNGTAGASGGGGASGDGGGGLGGGQSPPGSSDGNQNLFLAGFSSGGGSGNQNLSQDVIGEVIVQTPDTSETTTPTTTEATTTTATTTEATTTTATTTEATTTTATTTEATTTAATTTEPTTTTTATTTEATTTEATTTQETTTTATTTTATTTTATTTAATTTLAPPPPPPPSTKTASGPLDLGPLGNASFTASINSATGMGSMSLTGQTTSVMTSGDAFSASFGGSMSDGTAFDGKLQSLLGSYKGLISSLYVNSSGGVGFLTGSLSGEYCFETGSFSATGPLKSSPVLGYAGISPYQLGAALEADSVLFADLPLPILTSVSVVGSINPGGTASSSITGLETTDGGLLGVWAVSTSGGSYSNASNSPAWSGHYIDSGGDGQSPFFMMGDISGTDDLAGHVGIQGDLDYIDLDYRGRIGLSYLGFYDQPDGYGGFDAYSSIGAGTYALEPWHLSGSWGMGSFGFSDITGPASVFVDNDGALMPIAHEFGLFGLMPGSGGGFDLLAMGAYLHEPEYSIGSGNHIWMSPVIGFTLGMSEGEASGVTLFWGYTGGFWKSGLMEGIGAGLYFHAENSETGPVTIGTLLGDLSGEYFPGVAGSGADGSWRATGGLSFVGTPVTVNDPGESLLQSFLLGNDFQPAFLTGGFGAGGTEGTIHGGASGELIYASADGMNRFPGFYGLWFGIPGGVSAPGEYYGRPAGESGWTAIMGSVDGEAFGEGEFIPGSYWIARAEGELTTEGGISGSLSGKVLTESMLGSFSGPVYGLWTETWGYGGYFDGTWVGESLGSFEGQPLAFGGWTSGALMYYDGEWLSTGGYGEGFLGGTESNLWTGQPVSVTLMGSYDTSEIDGPFLMYGSGFYLEGGSISGGSADQNGAFDGYMVGSWRNGSFKANIVSLYVDPEGTAGYLKGSVSGSYYRDLLMWEADGTLNAYPVLVSSGIDPSSLSQLTVMETFGGYSGTGSFDGGGLLQAGFAAGDPVRIEGMNWGIWNAGFGGSYSGTTTGNWRLLTGGYYNWDGYWIGELSGSQTGWGSLDGGYADITGIYNGRVLTETAYHVFSGDILGTRWGMDGQGEWQAAAIGTYTMAPLAFNGLFDGSSIWGNLGGFAELWTAGATPTGASFLILGEYENLSVSSAFSAEIGSYNPVDYSPTIMNPEDGSQNGAYFGYLTGRVLPDDGMEGNLLALYLDPSGNAGILKGGFTGTLYPGLDMWEGQGSIFSIELVAGTTLSGSSLHNDVGYGGLLYTGSASLQQGYGGFAGSFFNLANLPEGFISLEAYTSQHAGIGGALGTVPWSLGVQATEYSGTYSELEGTAYDRWALGYEMTTGSSVLRQVLLSEPGSIGGQWSDGQVSAKGYGAWVNWNSAVTGVSGGELQGTFDPANLTWQAAAQWAHVDTNTFLALANTEDGRNRLAQLNIPAIEVGRADLTGSNGEIMVNMPGTAFFAYSTGDSPRIWGAGDVQGSYGSTVPQPGLNVILSAPNNTTVQGLGANFQFNNNTLGSAWGANIDGGGTVGGHSIGFSGAAAGSIDAVAKEFSGTASGTAFAPSGN